MRRGVSTASVTRCRNESTDVSITKGKSGNNEPGKVEYETKEIIESNNDGNQNDAMEGTREINFHNSITMTQSDFLFT